jgi:putative addiction module component (TIGR02574 family)
MQPERRVGGRGWWAVERYSLRLPAGQQYDLPVTSKIMKGNDRNEQPTKSARESRRRKFDLLDAPWDSLEANELSLTTAQREELDHHLTEYQRDPNDVIPWEQVRQACQKNSNPLGRLDT